jgi:hypothetical protein
MSDRSSLVTIAQIARFALAARRLRCCAEHINSNRRRVVNTVRLVVKIPIDIKDWLAKRAEHFGATLGAEVSRCCRASMEEEAAQKRAIASPPAAE